MVGRLSPVDVDHVGQFGFDNICFYIVLGGGTHQANNLFCGWISLMLKFVADIV